MPSAARRAAFRPPSQGPSSRSWAIDTCAFLYTFQARREPPSVVAETGLALGRLVYLLVDGVGKVVPPERNLRVSDSPHGSDPRSDVACDLQGEHGRAEGRGQVELHLHRASGYRQLVDQLQVGDRPPKLRVDDLGQLALHVGGFDLG